MNSKTKKQTKEENQLFELLELYGQLQDLKKQDQLRSKSKRNDESTLEKAKKLLEKAKIELPSEDNATAGTKRPSASLRHDITQRNEQKKPRLMTSANNAHGAAESTTTSPSSTQHRHPEKAGSSQIFVGDLNENLSAEEHRRLIEEHFSKFGKILSIRLLHGRNYGFVIFENSSQAEEAILKMNRQTLGGFPIRVSWAKEREQRGYDDHKQDRSFGSYHY
jgi:RNA recognition motif-containing protein